MIRLTIDGREVQVPEGATILLAARKLGIDVPALCFMDGCDASTSCMACVVRVGDDESLVPSCATKVRAGMKVTSETPEIRAARKTALELLLSDHTGDCVAPCQRADPKHLNLPRFVRQVAARDLVGARTTLEAAGLTEDDAVDTSRAEQACRRARIDGGVNLGLLIRWVMDATSGQSARGEPPPAYREFSTGMGRLSDEDLQQFLTAAASHERLEIDGAECSADEICREAERCLRCDCRKNEECRLRHYCSDYGARQATWRGAKRIFEQRLDHPLIILESGKCIACGLCVQVAEQAGERIGLVLENRGFGVRVAVPFGYSLAEGLEKCARRVVEVCPTGAFALRDVIGEGWAV